MEGTQRGAGQALSGKPRAVPDPQPLDSINQKMEEKGFGSNPNLTPATQPKAPTPSWKELNEARAKRYQENHGLFLIHSLSTASIRRWKRRGSEVIRT